MVFKTATYFCTFICMQYALHHIFRFIFEGTLQKHPIMLTVAKPLSLEIDLEFLSLFLHLLRLVPPLPTRL